MEKLNLIKVEKRLRERGISLFSPLDFQRLFSTSIFASKNFINRHVSTGLFIKIRNGLYAFAESKPSKFILSNKLYSPSYISFETALSYYHIIPESIYTIFSATPQPSRKFEALDTEYLYHRIKRKLFFGYIAKRVDNATVLIAEPEKALVDYLYFVDLKKKKLNERIDITSLSQKTILRYVRIFRRKGLVDLVGEIYDKRKNNKRIN